MSVGGERKPIETVVVEVSKEDLLGELVATVPPNKELAPANQEIINPIELLRQTQAEMKQTSADIRMLELKRSQLERDYKKILDMLPFGTAFTAVLHGSTDLHDFKNGRRIDKIPSGLMFRGVLTEHESVEKFRMLLVNESKHYIILDKNRALREFTPFAIELPEGVSLNSEIDENTQEVAVE